MLFIILKLLVLALLSQFTSASIIAERAYSEAVHVISTQKDYPRGIELLKVALATDPKNGEYNQLLGSLLIQSNESERAHKHLKAAVLPSVP